MRRLAGYLLFGFLMLVPTGIFFMLTEYKAVLDIYDRILNWMDNK